MLGTLSFRLAHVSKESIGTLDGFSSLNPISHPQKMQPMKRLGNHRSMLLRDGNRGKENNEMFAYRNIWK